MRGPPPLLAADSVNRGYMTTSDYRIGVEASFGDSAAQAQIWACGNRSNQRWNPP